MEADDLALAEIDENLARGDLSPAERAIHVQRRKEIYERQHGPAKATGARASNVRRLSAARPPMRWGTALALCDRGKTLALRER